jgi:hypothetical protein
VAPFPLNCQLKVYIKKKEERKEKKSHLVIELKQKYMSSNILILDSSSGKY